MKHSFLLWIFVITLGACAAFSQVATGTPPFNSFGGGPFDIINLGNLNVHFSIPVLHRAGRGLPFAYDLTYDSSIWTAVTSNGVTQWQPDANWGWSGSTQSTLGYVPMTITSGSCKVFKNGRWVNENYTTYTTQGYVDRFGVLHPAQIITSSDPNEDCTADISSGSATSTDGSGYTISIANYVSATVTSVSGVVIKPGSARNLPSSAATITDANGNQITEDTSGNFYDTLSTSKVLWISSPAPPSSTTFTYNNPVSTTSTYTMAYQQYTVQTGFGFTSNPVIQDYGPKANYLVSSIILPDGSSYQFDYEDGPSSCMPCKTGRIKKVTLPTGGTITYQYNGGTNGSGIYFWTDASAKPRGHMDLCAIAFRLDLEHTHYRPNNEPKPNLDQFLKILNKQQFL
jgi:hypothetical protein